MGTMLFLYKALRSDVIKRWQYFYTRSFSFGWRKSSSPRLWAFNNEFLWLLNIYLVLSCPWSPANEVPLQCLMKGYLSKYIFFIIFSIHKNMIINLFSFFFWRNLAKFYKKYWHRLDIPLLQVHIKMTIYEFLLKFNNKNEIYGLLYEWEFLKYNCNLSILVKPI